MSFPTYADHGSGLSVDRYPADLYAGDTGEVSATLRRADAEHDLVYPSGGSADYLATGVTTRGEFGLYRWNMAAAPGGPDPHFHKSLSESFFVLDGTIRLFDGKAWADGHAGDYMFVPEGGVHGFRNESGEPASMLILFAPGAPREGYFEGLAEWATGPKPTDDERAEFMLRHDTFWV
jgi:mannose-6-phosphate isomerase-like protein (cupin superfamily)